MKRITRSPLYEWHYIGDIYKDGQLIESTIVEGPWDVQTKKFDITSGYFILDGDPCIGGPTRPRRHFFKAENINDLEFAELLINDTKFFQNVYGIHSLKDQSHWFHIHECECQLEILMCLEANNHPNLPIKFEELKL